MTSPSVPVESREQPSDEWSFGDLADIGWTIQGRTYGASPAMYLGMGAWMTLTAGRVVSSVMHRRPIRVFLSHEDPDATIRELRAKLLDANARLASQQVGYEQFRAERDRARDLAAHLEEQLAAKRRLPKDVCGARDGADVVCMLPPHSVELLPEGDPNHHRWHQDWRGGQLWAEWSSVTEHYDKGRLWPDGRIGPRAALAAHLEAEQAEER